MGIRLIEDFLAKSGWTRCSDFRETAQIISAVAFKMFLNCCPRVMEIEGNEKEFGLVFTGEGEATLPIYEFVHLPDEFVKEGLIYANILPGLIKGALEMVSKESKREAKYDLFVFLPVFRYNWIVIVSSFPTS